MKYFKKIMGFYVNSNIHVGIATACLVLVSFYNVNNPVSKQRYFYFVFFSTILAYHFVRIFENCECTIGAVLAYLKKQSFGILSVSFVALIGTIYFGYLIGLNNLWIIFPAILITLFYAIPFFKYKGERVSLRNYPRLKILSIALVWTMLTVSFPLQSRLFDPQVWIEFIQRFFLIIVLIIPFDIRDMSDDAPHLKTLPQQIGIYKAKRIGVLLLMLFFILMFLKHPIEATSIFAELSVFVISLLFLVKAKQQQSQYYASFWVESIPIIWLLTILVFIAFKSEVVNLRWGL